LWGALPLFGGAIQALCKPHPRNSWSTRLPPAPPHGGRGGGAAATTLAPPLAIGGAWELAGPTRQCRRHVGALSGRGLSSVSPPPGEHPCACAGAGPAAFSPRARSGTTAVAHTSCAQRCSACGPDVLAEIKPDLSTTHCLRAGPACEPRQDPARHRHGRLRYGPARVGAARRVVDAPPPPAPPSRRW